jgi:hypothetical protein
MRYSEITEGRHTGIHEVYHWTSAENLVRILNEGQINVGASKHELGGKTLHGVSVTRDGWLDLSNTYAISGRKAWRIGLDYNKLRQRNRVLPIRDEYLRGKPMRTTQAVGSDIFGRGGYKQTVSSDEAEEFVLNDISLSYMTSLAVEDRFVDVTAHPESMAEDPEYYEDFDLEHEDGALFFSLLAHLHPDIFALLTKRRPFRPQMVETQDVASVPFLMLMREPHREVPVRESLQWIIDSHKNIAPEDRDAA